MQKERNLIGWQGCLENLVCLNRKAHACELSQQSQYVSNSSLFKVEKSRLCSQLCPQSCQVIQAVFLATLIFLHKWSFLLEQFPNCAPAAHVRPSTNVAISHFIFSQEPILNGFKFNFSINYLPTYLQTQLEYLYSQICDHWLAAFNICEVILCNWEKTIICIK